MFKIREYKTGDAEKIYTLFSKYTSYKRDAAFWVWINRLLSENKSLISVAEEDNQIIGHYAIIPRNCIINKKIYRTGLGVHAFVAPEYRDSISIFDITSHAYRFAKNNEIDFIYGFPNQNYRLVQEKIEKWKKVALFNAFEKDANNLEPGGTIFKWESFNLKDFDKIFILNELVEECGNSNDIYFSKPLPFIVNRYLNHPQNIYQTWLLKDEDKYVGFIITKIFDSENEKRAHIIDYVLSPEYETDTLIADFEIKFSREVDKFVLWPFSNKFNKSLLKRNFSESGFETFFGIKFLSESAKKATDDILNFNNWHLTMGDSDAF